jgi:hypothetical protein
MPLASLTGILGVTGAIDLPPGSDPLSFGAFKSRRVRVRTRRPTFALLPLLGWSIGHHTGPRTGLPDVITSPHQSSPRFETSAFPPPRALVRTAGHRVPSASPIPGRLFPRAGRTRTLTPLPKPLAPRDHPAVRDLCRTHIASRRVVRPGDTLWSIAASLLRTEDPQRIASFWARVYRLNHPIVGSNPDLIFPGQELRLPRARAR